MSDQEEKKTKETDKTNESAETAVNVTPPDEETKTGQPDETVLEVTVKEKMRPEIKTALVVLALTLPCIVYVYLIAFSDKVLTSDVYFNTFIFAAIAGVVCAIFGTLVLTHSEKRTPIELLISLFLIFTIPTIAFIIPLSKYHNLNQIEQDKKIVEIFQISKEKDKIMIILPDEHYQEHKYLKKVLSVACTWTNDKKPWKEIAIPCRRGNEYWYEATIGKLTLDQTGKKAYFILFFNHAWKNLEITKEVLLSDPNSL